MSKRVPQGFLLLWPHYAKHNALFRNILVKLKTCLALSTTVSFQLLFRHKCTTKQNVSFLKKLNIKLQFHLVNMDPVKPDIG